MVLLTEYLRRCQVKQAVSPQCLPADCMYLLNSISLHAGVESVHIDLPSQKVLVKGSVTPEAVVQQVSKTGKPTELWS